MHFSKKFNYLLLGLMVILNIVIRIPSIPHERGSPDEFTMHGLANSLNTLGYANWWAHPSSIFGFYPYSYASASSFLFSEVAQATGMSMEIVTWLVPTVLGIFIMLSAYLLAGLIKDDDLFRFLGAFTVSISPGILNYLTWQVSARGLFIAILPFFIYIVLKNRVSSLKFGIIAFIMFMLLMATHNYYILTLPVIVSYVVAEIYFREKDRFDIPEYVVSLAIIGGFFMMFMIPFFTGLFIQGSRYSAVYSILENNIRYSGPIIFFAMGGFSYLALKSNKEFAEIVLLLSMVFFAPFLYIERYAQFISVTYISLLTCIGILNVKSCGFNKKLTFSIIAIALLVFAGFSGFYQHWRTGEDEKVDKWYMEESTYNAATWVKANMEGERLVGNDDHISTRILAESQMPTLVVPETDMAYGFVTESNITNVSMNSPFSFSFYMDDPYKLDTPYHETDSLRWQLELYEVDRGYAQNIISKFGLTYYVENSDYTREEFVESLEDRRDKVYHNGRLHIWSLEKIID